MHCFLYLVHFRRCLSSDRMPLISWSHEAKRIKMSPDESLMKYTKLFEIPTDAFNQSQRLSDALRCCRLFWFGLKWSGGECESILRWLIGNCPVYFLRRMLSAPPTRLLLQMKDVLARLTVFYFLFYLFGAIYDFLCWICEDSVYWLVWTWRRIDLKTHYITML